MAYTNRCQLVEHAPWTIALIIAATIEKRSSIHPRNSQKFNHGRGFVIGHQWTNIVLVINDQTIPLPPIAFLCKKERQRLGIGKETEHQALKRYVQQLDLQAIVGPHPKHEVVVLMDSGYDDKAIQKAILAQGWDFVGALKSNRSVKASLPHGGVTRKSYRVDKVFWSCRSFSPWKTIRIRCEGYAKKRKEFRVREQLGFLKGVIRQVKLVFSEERGHRKGRKYLACSNISVKVTAVIQIYRKRWRIELFHKVVKTLLGFEDVSCHDISSVKAHVHWVYCAYLLLPRLTTGKKRLSEAIHNLELQLERQKMSTILQLLNRFNGVEAVKTHCNTVIEELLAA